GDSQISAVASLFGSERRSRTQACLRTAAASRDHASVGQMARLARTRAAAAAPASDQAPTAIIRRRWHALPALIARCAYTSFVRSMPGIGSARIACTPIRYRSGSSSRGEGSVDDRSVFMADLRVTLG